MNFLKDSTATSSRTARAGAPPAPRDSSSRTGDRFHLLGPSLILDPRLHAYRKDLADISLAERIFAPHYARPVLRGCGSRAALLWPGPAAEGDALSELLPGEEFAVLEYAGGWAWGYAATDGVVGYVEAIALAEPIRPTHIVCERRAPVAADGKIQSAIIAALPMGARLRGTETGACLATEYGCVASSHLRPIEDYESDPLLVAERLLGAPWRAGGRSADGIDAAGLVQLALGLCGLAAPRFVEQQRNLGTPAPEGSRPRRGELILFEGGAGLMIDDLMLLHASRSVGKVTAEPLALAAGPAFERRRLPL